MPGITVDATLNNNQFMTQSKDIARAIASLKSTVVQTGKVMGSAATGYGTAMVKNIRASREFEKNVRGIMDRMSELSRSIGSFESASRAFNDAKGAAEKLDKQIESISDRMKEIADAGGGAPTKSWEENKAQIESATAALEKYERQYKEFKETRDWAQERLNKGTDESGPRLLDAEKETYSADVKAYSKSMDEARVHITDMQTQVKALEAEQQRLIAQGENLPTAEYQKLSDEIDRMQKRRANMEKELGEMRKKGWDKVDQSAEYNRQVQEYNRLKAALEEVESVKERALKPPYIKSWENMTRLTGMIAEGFGRVENVAAGAIHAIIHPFQSLDRALGTIISKTAQAVSAFARFAGSAAISFLKRLASQARNAAIQLAKLAANAVVSGFRKIASGAAMAAKSILNFNRSHRNTNSTLKVGLKNILRYAFGVRSMFFLFRRLRQAVIDGFGELKKQNPEVKASLDRLSRSLSALKGSLATTFAPIVTAVAPMLTQLMDMLTNAINTIGAFFAALMGKTTVTKSIGKIGSTAKSSSKSVKELKRQLAGFDELNILSADKGNSGSGSSGKDSGFAYKTENIESGIRDFVAKLKDLWTNGEYESVGNAIAEGINNAFTFAKKKITWENVEDTVTGAITAIAGVFNGLIDPVKGVDFNRIGETVSEGVRTILNSLNLLILAVKWGNVGAGLANFFNGLFGNEKTWESIHTAITNAIQAVIDFGAGFIETFEEGKIAKGILAAIGDASTWENLAAQAWAIIKKAFNKSGNFLNVLFGGKDYSKAQKDAENFYSLQPMMRQRPANIEPEITIEDATYDAMWNDLATNFADGINAFVKNAAAKLEDLPVQPVIDGISDWVERFQSGISFEGLGEFIGTGISKAIEGISAVINNFSERAPMLGAMLSGFLRGLIRKAFSGSPSLGDTFTKLVSGAFDFIKAFLEGFNPVTAADTLKEKIGEIEWDSIAHSAWDAFKVAVQKLGSFLTVLFGGEVDFGDSAVDVDAAKREQNSLRRGNESKSMVDISANAFTSVITNVANSLKTMFESVDWESLGETIHDWIEKVDWVAVGTSILQAFQALFNGLFTLLNRAFGSDSTKAIDEFYSHNAEAQSKAMESALNQISTLSEEQKKALTLDRSIASEDAIKEADKILSDGIAAIRVQTAVFEAYAAFASGDDDEQKVKDILSELQKYMPEWIKAGSVLENVLQVGDIGKYLEGRPEKGPNGDYTLSLTLDEEETAGLEKAMSDTTDAVNENTKVHQYDASKDSDWQGMLAEARAMFDTGNYSVEEIVAATTEAERPAQVEAMRSAIAQFDIDGLVSRTEEMANAGFSLVDVLSDLRSKGLSDDQMFELRLALGFGGNPMTNDEFAEAMKGVGTDAADGLADGYHDELEAKGTDIKNDTLKLEEEARDVLKSKSPSKVFVAIGRDIVAGLVIGLSGMRKAFNSVLSGLPSWAQTLLGNGNLDVGLKLGGGGGAKDTKTSKRQTKEVKKNTKELIKNTKKRGEVDVNYEGVGFDTSGDRPKLNVGVNFVPEGKGEDEEMPEGGILGWLQALLNAEDVSVAVSLIRSGFDNVAQWLLDNGWLGEKAEQLIGLIREGDWGNVAEWLQDNGWLGEAAKQLVKLVKEGDWNGVVDWLSKEGYLGKNVEQLVQLVKDGNWSGVIDWLSKNKLFGPKLEQLITLVKDGNWTGVLDWLSKNKLFGPAVEQLVTLVKEKGWSGVIDWLTKNKYFGPVVEQFVTLVKEKNWAGIAKLFGISENSPVMAFVKAVLESGWKGISALFGLKDGNILEVIGKLLSNPATGSSTIGGLFGTILNIAGNLLSNPATGSSTIGGLFGTILGVFGKLSTTKADGSSTIDSLFGTVLGVFGKLSTTKADGSSTIDILFGTILDIFGKLSTTKASGSSTIDDVFGTILSIAGKLSGDMAKGSSTIEDVFGTLLGVDAGLKGTTTGGKGNSWKSTIDALFGTVLGVDAGLKGTTKGGKGNDWKTSPSDLFGSSVSFVANLIKNGSNWSNAGGLGKWFDSLFKAGYGAVSLVGNLTTNDSNWKRTPGGLNGWFSSQFKNGATVKMIGDLQKSGSNWGNGLQSWFDAKNGGDSDVTSKAYLTNKGTNWKDGILKFITGDAGGIVTIALAIGGTAWNLVKSALHIFNVPGFAEGGIVTAAGRVLRFANGGSIMNSGRASWWDSVNKYAAGTSRVHGTLFVAGENGPEIMGHVNGRTEILNKSQLAEAIYGAVVSGMAQAVNALGKYIANHMSVCTNAIVSTIGANASLANLDYYAPAMANGVMPYEVSAQIARSTQELKATLNDNNEDLIQAMVSAIGNAASTIVAAVQQGNRVGARTLTAQDVIDEINRQTIMRGRSILKGV